MARHLDGETKRRFAIANATIESCAEIVQNPEVRRATNGLADEAFRLLNLLYVPNRKGERYLISPKQKGEEGIPLIITVPGEKKTAHCNADHFISPRQWVGVLAAMEAIDPDPYDVEEVKNWIQNSYLQVNKNGNFKVPSLDPDDGGQTWSPAGAIGLNADVNGRNSKTYSIEGRPVISYNELVNTADGGGLLLHELVHAYQHVRGRIYPAKGVTKESRVKCELEAYQVQATADSIINGVDIDENPYEWNSFGIEAIRRRVNADQDDPFHVSKKLLSEIKLGGWALL